MSEEAGTPSGTPKDAAGGGLETESKPQNKKPDSVSHESFTKLLNEKKASDQKLAEAQERLEAAEKEKLAESGRYKDLYEKEAKKVKEKEESHKELIKGFGRANLTNSLKAKLAEKGCVDSDFVIQGLDLKDAKFISDYNVDPDYINEVVADLVEKKQYLFKKEVEKINDRTPGGNAGAVKSSAQLRYGDKK